MEIYLRMIIRGKLDNGNDICYVSWEVVNHLIFSRSEAISSIITEIASGKEQVRLRKDGMLLLPEHD
jgi:hypothetical protein